MNKERKRAKRVKKAMRLTWWSLNSHLYWAHASKETRKRESADNHKFHKKMVGKYIKVFILLKKLY